MSEMSINIGPLLVTPLPEPYESQIGYLARLTKANGYDKATDFLTYGGVNESQQRLVGICIKKLGKLVCHSDAELETINYRCHTQAHKHTRHIVLNGHRLHTSYLDMKKIKICPKCVELSKTINIPGYLKYHLVCSTHNVKLINACSQCHKSFRWNLSAPYLCQCGCDLRETSLEPVFDHNLLTLMGILKDRLTNQDVAKKQAKKSGFPVDNLYAIEFNSVLGILHRLMKLFESQSKYDAINLKTDLAKLSYVATALANWPHNFRTSIFDLIKQKNKGLHEMTFKRVEQSFRSFFKSTLCKKDIQFVEEGFKGVYDILFADGYEDLHFKCRQIDKRFKPYKHLTKIKDVAYELNIQPSTVRSLIKAEQIFTKIYDKGTRKIKIYTITESTRRRISGKSLSAREAAKTIGLPVSIIKQLRKQGCFIDYYIGDKLTSFHETDVARFINFLNFQIRKRSYATNLSNCETTLENFLKMKTYSIQQKSLIIHAILTTKLKDSGRRAGNSFQDIVVLKKHIDYFIQYKAASFFDEIKPKSLYPKYPG